MTYSREYGEYDAFRRPFDTVKDHRTTDLKPHVVYVHLDADGYALYIGSTSNLKRRQVNHRQSEWWPQVAETRTVGKWTKEIALGVERGLIERFQPPYNGAYTKEWERALRERAGRPRPPTYYPRMKEIAPDVWDRIAEVLYT